ncbi:MAG: hypothetical protein R3A79_08190 [Nannocystaceae bacterium]
MTARFALRDDGSNNTLEACDDPPERPSPLASRCATTATTLESEVAIP